MKEFKQLQTWSPEMYFVASVIFYWVSTSTLLNPVAFILLLALSALFKWKSRVTGILISFSFLLFSLFMVLALLSELTEFSEFNSNAWSLIGVGGTWLGLNIIASILMLKKWGKQESAVGLNSVQSV